MAMKETVRTLIIIHMAVLALTGLGAGLLWGGVASGAALAGALAFSVPVVTFSLMVVRASAGDSSRFWGRFMVAEMLKWGSSTALLALAFASTWFAPLPLLSGFFLSVFVQVFFPIFIRRESQS